MPDAASDKPAPFALGSRWRSGSIAAPFIVFCVTLAAYVASLPRTVAIEDSGEFVTSAVLYGVPHPSGYPLFVILGHAFSALPFGPIPWRVAALSAVCAAGAAAFLAVIARRVVFGDAPRSYAREFLVSVPVVVVAVSATWWGQAVVADVYGLHVVLQAAAAYFFLKSLVGSPKWLDACALSLGLGASNHLFLTVPTLPFFAAAAVYAQRSFVRDWRPWFRAAAFFVAGLVPYVLLPLRSGSSFVAADLSSLDRIVAFVLRKNYGDAGLAAWNKFGLLVDTFGRYAADVGAGMLLAAAVGAAVLIVGRGREKKAAAIVLSGWVAVIPLVVLGRSIGWSSGGAYVTRVYGLTVLAAVAICAAVGLDWMRERMHSHTRAIGIAAILAVCAAGLHAIPEVSALTDPFPARYMAQAISSLPASSVLVVDGTSLAGDTGLFVLAYLQRVEGVRRDVTVIADGHIGGAAVPRLPFGYEKFSVSLRRRMLVEAAGKDPRFSGRPLYASFVVDGVVPGRNSQCNGVVCAVVAEHSPSSLPFRDVALPERVPKNAALEEFVAQAHYLRALAIVETEGNRAALPDLFRAIELDSMPFSTEYVSYMAHRNASVRFPSVHAQDAAVPQ